MIDAILFERVEPSPCDVIGHKVERFVFDQFFGRKFCAIPVGFYAFGLDNLDKFGVQ